MSAGSCWQYFAHCISSGTEWYHFWASPPFAYNAQLNFLALSGTVWLIAGFLWGMADFQACPAGHCRTVGSFWSTVSFLGGWFLSAARVDCLEVLSGFFLCYLVTSFQFCSLSADIVAGFRLWVCSPYRSSACYFSAQISRSVTFSSHLGHRRICSCSWCRSDFHCKDWVGGLLACRWQ